MYHHLLDYLSQWNKGGLYLIKHKQAIVSWSICLIDGPVMLYLYGASDRSRWNTWWHHLLKSELIQYAINHKLETFDFFWAAPSGYDDHHLAGVSRFKESFGGLKTEYYGSYDIVTNQFWYQMMKWRKS
jgi:lipid II:glycine glycyltransferase (peptidoglycan interpeptide bridge formation enzyme)